MKEKELAPNFKIPSSNNKEFELKKNKNKFLVIYFYPRDNTPGCTNEAKDFSKLYKEFKRLNCEIFGISKDTIESHKKFIKNQDVNADLFSLKYNDPVIKNDLIKRTNDSFNKGIFGVPTFIVNGKMFWGQDRLDFVLNEAKK